MNIVCVVICGDFWAFFEFSPLSGLLKRKILKTGLKPPQTATNSDFEVQT